jgi:hypothetical protein
MHEDLVKVSSGLSDHVEPSSPPVRDRSDDAVSAMFEHRGAPNDASMSALVAVSRPLAVLAATR